MSRGNALLPGRQKKVAPDFSARFCDTDTGRIDARRIAAFLDLPLAALARLLGRSTQAVYKTPDAKSLQNGLAVYVRIATALLALFGSEKKARAWLASPHRALDGERPLKLIRQGMGEIVADLLEDALLGHPG